MDVQTKALIKIVKMLKEVRDNMDTMAESIDLLIKIESKKLSEGNNGKGKR